MRKVQNLNIDEYAAVIAVGGDGTVNELINGMLTRPDKTSIPMGCLPNGSGDDFCQSIGLGKGDVDGGLAYIKAAQTIKVDLIKILVDYETEEDLEAAIQADPTIKKEQHLRYGCVNTWFSLAA